MPHIIVPTSTRSSSETRAERRRREEEERRRVRTMLSSAPTSAPAPFPTRQDSRNISTWEETIGSGPLTQEQPDAKYLGWGGIGSELARPYTEAYKQTVSRAVPLGYTVSPWLDYDRPDMFREGWTKPRVPTRMTGNPMIDLLGTFKPTEDPVGETAKKSWEHFKRTGQYGGLTEEQYAAMPLSEQLLVEGGVEMLLTGGAGGLKTLAGAGVKGLAARGAKAGIRVPESIQGIREAQRAKTLMSMPMAQPKPTTADLQRFAGLGKVTPEQMVRPTTLEGNQALSQLADQQALNYLQSPEQIRFASGLSGIDTVGGALDSKGIRIVDQAEWDAAKVAARNETFGTNFKPKDFTSEAAFQALRASKPQHWHVSPVCVNLSAAKVGRNLDPNDIAIGRSVVRVINEISPPSISLENVPGYAGFYRGKGGIWVQKEDEVTELYQNITKALDEAGYAWDTNIVEAADYGAAQARVRLILRAVRKDVGELPPLPQKTHNFSGTGQGEDWYSLLEDLIDGEVKVPLSQLLAGPNSPVDEINRIKGTFGRKVGDRLRLEPNRPIITMGASASKGLPNARNAGGPAPTLLAGHGVPRIIIPGAKGLDDATVVRVTPEMMKRLMGLPENFRAPTRPSIAKVTLGNGVHGAVTRDFIQPLVDVHRAAPSGRSMTDAFSAARAAPTAPSRAAADIPSRIHISDIPMQSFKNATNAHRVGFTGIARKLEDFSGSGGHTSLFDESVDADVLDAIATNLNLNTVTFRMRDNAAKQVYNATQESLVERGLPETFNVFRVGKLPPTGAPTPVSLDKGILGAVHLTGKTQDAPILRMYEVSRKDVLADINAVSRNDFILEEELLIHAENLRFVADIDIAARAASEAPIGGIRPRAGGDIAIDAQGQTRQLESGVRGPSQAADPPMTQAIRDGDIPPGRPPDEGLPVDDGFGWSDNEINGKNPWGFRNVEQVLTQTQQFMNKWVRGILVSQPVRTAAGKIKEPLMKTPRGQAFAKTLEDKARVYGTLDDPIAQGAVTELNRGMDAVERVADRASYLADDIIEAFAEGLSKDELVDFRATTRIERLRGVDDALIVKRFGQKVSPNAERLAPTITDIAARLPIYEQSGLLTNRQLNSLYRLKDLLEESRSLLDEVGNQKIFLDKKRGLVIAQQLGQKVKAVEWDDVVSENPLQIGNRPDVMEGGFYIARGNAYEEVGTSMDTINSMNRITNDLPRKQRGTNAKVERKSAQYDSQSAGLSDGFEYAPFSTIVRNQMLKYGNEALDHHISNYYRSLTDEAGQYLGRTQKMRMLADKEIGGPILRRMEGLRLSVKSLKAKLGRTQAKERAVIDSFLDGELDSIEDMSAALEDIRIARGKSQGKGVRELLKDLEDLKAEVKEFTPKYNRAKDKFEYVSPERQIAGGKADRLRLDKLEFPEFIAQATTKALVDRTNISKLSWIKAYNSFFRGVNATLDNSGLGIQGIVGLASELFDVTTWKTLASGKLPQGPYSQALAVNLKTWRDPDTMRAFLNTFDARATENGVMSSMDWTKFGIKGGPTEITEAFAGGRIGAAVERIGPVKAANRAFQDFGHALRLGWANKSLMDEMKRSGRAVQDLIDDGTVEELAKVINNMTGHSGRRFGGTIGEFVMYAPRFLQARLETLGKGALGTAQTVMPGTFGELRPAQREARNALMRLIGGGTALTFAANSLRGYPTDINPWAKTASGETIFNPNFMRIRNVLGRDWSVFGTYDSILRGIVSTVDPRIGNAYPGSDLLLIAPSGVVSGLNKLAGIEPFPYPHRIPNITEDPVSWAGTLVGEFVPFSFEELPSIAKESWGEEGLGKPGQMLGRAAGLIAGEAVGAKSSPLRKREKEELLGTPSRPIGGSSGGRSDRFQPITQEERLRASMR